jgi:hypothetical protein
VWFCGGGLRPIEGDRLPNKRLEGGLVNFFSFMDVDRAAAFASTQALAD